MTINRHSLFVKLITPIIVLFLIGGVVLAFLIPSLVEKNVQEQTIYSAQQTVAQFKAVRGYYTKNVIAKVNKTSELKPSYNHASEPNGVPLPATMIHDLSASLQNQGTNLKLYSDYPFPVRSARQLDDFEREAWKALVADPKMVYSRVENKNGKEVIRVAIADLMVADACVSCHNSHPETPKVGWKIGDVRGVLEVETDITEQLAEGVMLSNLILAIIALLATISLVAMYFVHRLTISKPICEVVSALNHISEGDGDLTRRLDESQDNEIGAIAASFNHFSEKIRETVARVIEQSEELRRTSIELGAISATSNQAILQQDQDTEAVATAINELSATAQQIADSARTAAVETEETAEATRIGKEVTDKSVNATNELSEEISAAAQALEQLKTNSDNIGSVLDVIRAIAEQTNLLALNAAIEAARAGEQGRGFAVVADEVRTLASRTQDSTQEIQEMTEQLRSATTSVVSAMESSRDKAVSTLDLANEVGGHLTHINESISNITAMNTQVATAAGEQGRVADEINGNVNGISQMAQSTSHGAHQMQQHIQELENSVNQLHELTKHFKI